MKQIIVAVRGYLVFEACLLLGSLVDPAFKDVQCRAGRVAAQQPADIDAQLATVGGGAKHFARPTAIGLQFPLDRGQPERMPRVQVRIQRLTDRFRRGEAIERLRSLVPQHDSAGCVADDDALRRKVGKRTDQAIVHARQSSLLLGRRLYPQGRKCALFAWRAVRGQCGLHCPWSSCTMVLARNVRARLRHFTRVSVNRNRRSIARPTVSWTRHTKA
nr:hypothetical protein [Sphingomonas hengshuiensis]